MRLFTPTFHHLRRSVAAVITMALAILGLTAIVSPVAAQADTSPPVGTPATVSADALPTWQVNGVVWSQAVAGNTVYVAGSFSKARPPGVPVGGAGEVAAANVFAFDITTGNRVASFNHSLNAQGLVVSASPDGTRVYVGGDFTTVDGAARNHIVAFNTATNAVDTAFAASISGQVRGIAVSATQVYAGGNFFSTNNGVARKRLAAFSRTSGAVNPTWAPTADDNQVWAIVLTPDSSRLIVGGAFTTINNASAYGMGSVDASTGASMPWAANQTVRDATNAGAINSLRTDGTQIYGSGFAFGDGSSFEGTFAADPTTGAINWVTDCHGDTYDVLPLGQVLYAVSHAHDCTPIGGWPDSNPRVFWQHATATSTYPTGTNTGPDSYGWNYNGVPAPEILQWYPTFTVGSYTGQYQSAWSLAGTSDYVVLGGEFPSVNGTAQQGLVRMARKALATNKRGPSYGTTPARPIPATTAVSLAAGTARVSFGTAWDQDNKTLTYDVQRDSGPFVFTTKIDSNFWTLPSGGFVDKGLVPGSTHTYQVRITDPYGNTQFSPRSNTVTVSSGNAQSQYASDISADGASHYWRAGEPSGTTAYDWTGFDDLTMSGGVTRGASGAIIGDSDGASGFDGNNGFGVTPSRVTGPNVFTEEAWFKTTSTTGGKIVSFGDQSTGNSNNYDRHIYMDPQGRVWFGVYNNGSYTVNTGNVLNDGQWHHAVGTMDPTGITLYVDGKRVGRNGGTSVAQPYDGYWRVGGDSAWNGNPYFNGTIDDVAIYPAALSIDQVQKHYTDSGRTLSIPPKPTDAYGLGVYNANPDLYWRLGESAGPVAKDTSLNAFDGVYDGGVTYGTPGAVPGTNTAVTLDGNNGAVAAAATVSNPTVYSEELWFKTTTGQGGKLIGFGSNQFGGSGGYDRHVYMFDSGQLRFGVWTGQTNVIDTTASYNDGAWHHMVASQGSDGMKLYVDGALVGTNPQTQAQNYDGYWRVGGDTTWGGNSSNYFAGSIDEVAVYSSVLSPSTVQAHYQAGSGVTPNQAPTAAFTSSVNKLVASFDGTGSTDSDGTISTYAWDFGDGGTAAVASPSHSYAAAGTYQVQLTVTDNQGATNSVTHAVTVVANQAPVAAFTSSSVNLVASFDGTGSSDPDGTVMGYAWDFGDGGTAAVVKPSHPYAAAGTFQVKLTATDNDGASTSLTKPVTVSAANVAPVAAFTSTVANLTASFDGSGSSDPDGTIASYAWTFGDGGTSTVAGPSHPYATAGTYQVTLTVTDNRGGTKAVTHQVIVTAAPAVPKPDHVVVVVMENHASGAIIGSPDAPYINSLATGGANMTQSFAITHPSEPNYLALFSGATQGLTDDSCPHSYTTTNLSDQLVAKSLTFTGYSEDLPSVGFTGCQSGTPTSYVRKHNPWANYPSVPASANQPFTAFPSDFTTLPTVSFVIPNLGHDMHDGTVNAGDTWLQSNLGAYATWAKTHNSLLVVTFDEDDNTANNQIATVLYGQQVKTGAYANPINHYSVLRTIQDAYGLPANDGSAGAGPITNTWQAANQAPVAAFSSTTSNLTATFDSSASSDPDGTVASYAWTFGDGGTSTSANPSHPYAVAGTYQVKLTVTDNAGATNAITQPVTVSATNQSPTAAFTLTAADLTASFNGTGSSDPDGTIASYAWTFGDGGTATGASPSHPYAAAGTYQVQLTVTDNQGATNAVTHPVTVTAPAVVTLASDAFTRTVASGWGSADTGGPWTGSTSYLSVANGVGVIRVPTAGLAPSAYLNGMTTTDSDLTVTMSSDKVGTGNGIYLFGVGRRVAGAGDYRVQLRLRSDGKVGVSLLSATAAGAQTVLKAEVLVPSYTFVSNDRLNVRLQVTGTSPTVIQTKVWPSTATEPATWLLNTSDSTTGLQAAGSVGLIAFLSGSGTNAPIAATFDNVLVRRTGQ